MKTLKNSILKFVNKPEPDIKSSQTLYECLFYNLNLYKIKKDDSYYKRCQKIANEICVSQLFDGGFDLGYDFIFGKDLHKKNKKEGTSPELLSITALSLYFEISDKTDLKVKSAINKGMSWIDKRIIKVDDFHAIPYAPDTYKYVHIINATSFCISAISTSIEYVDDVNLKLRLKNYLGSMYNFIYDQFILVSESSAYLPYFYINGSEFERQFVNDKIDNYHLAQQLYHHIIADKYFPSDTNKKCIHYMYNYLSSLIDADGFIPYTINNKSISDKVSVWGFSSVISAFSLYDYTYNTSSNVKSIVRYLKAYCWNGEYFNPVILNSTRESFDSNFYPRSDAWVIHAISDYMLYSSFDENLFEMSESSFLLIEKDNYIGLENHTITFRKKLFAYLVNIFGFLR